MKIMSILVKYETNVTKNDTIVIAVNYSPSYILYRIQIHDRVEMHSEYHLYQRKNICD